MKARLASGNRHKLIELRAVLPFFDLELLGAAEYPPETGATYVDNAQAKARFGLTIVEPDCWVLGEDSGIEVNGLGGEPGIRSARWAGDDDPVEALLRRLDGAEGDDRKALYHCELVVAHPRGSELRGTGVLRGSIATEPHGHEGFGYDPIFIPEGETQTVAVLGDDWKRQNSHRSRAAQALWVFFEDE